MLQDFLSKKKRKLDIMLENVPFERELYNELDGKPCPTTLSEFLEDPYKYHPTEEFMSANAVEVIYSKFACCLF